MNAELMAAVPPIVFAALGLLLRSRRGTANHWDVLHELARSRRDSAMERERRITLRMILDHPSRNSARGDRSSSCGDPSAVGEGEARDGRSI
jgi:hypothetical protein